jgi:hypothetical protein
VFGTQTRLHAGVQGITGCATVKLGGHADVREKVSVLKGEFFRYPSKISCGNETTSMVNSVHW